MMHHNYLYSVRFAAAKCAESASIIKRMLRVKQHAITEQQGIIERLRVTGKKPFTGTYLINFQVMYINFCGFHTLRELLPKSQRSIYWPIYIYTAEAMLNVPVDL